MKGIGPPRNPKPRDAPSAPPATDNRSPKTAATAITRSLGLERNFPNLRLPISLSFFTTANVPSVSYVKEPQHACERGQYTES